MRTIFTLLFTLFSIAAYSQLNLPKVQDQQTFAMQFLKTDIGIGLGGEYNYYAIDNLAIGGKIYYDWGRPYQSFFRSFGLDAGGSYSPFAIGDKVFVNLKLYGSLASQRLTDLSQINKNIFNYGAKAGGGLEYYLNSATVMELYGLQGFFFKKDLGKKMYELGLSLKIIL